MYQRPRKLAEFDIRVARVFSFIVGIMLVAFAYWRLSDDGTTAMTVLRLTLILVGIWCLYVAVFNRVRALKDIEHDGGVDPLLALVVFTVLILSFLVALVLPERSEKKR